MAEVLGAVSAASSLAEQTVKVIDAICEVYNKYKDPRFTMQQVQQLRDLASLLLEIQQTRRSSSGVLVAVLKACLRSVEAMKLRLADILVDDRDRKRTKLWKSIKGVKRKKEVIDLFRDIEQQKGSLSLAMSNEHKLQGDSHTSFLKKVDQRYRSQGNYHTALLRTIDNNTRTIRDVQSLPGKFYSVPSRGVRNFIGRASILNDIEASFFGQYKGATGPHVVVIQGLGGQGKTQIALEYCRRAKKSFRGIFWVNANSEASVKESFQGIAADIKSLGEEVPQDAANFVCKKLSLWREPWLLVLDNYDDVESFGNIQDFMPDNDKGCILVTSRSPETENLTSRQCAFVLEGLPEEHALELLKSTSRVVSFDTEITHAKTIISQLAYHPLAITQAGSYIKQQKLLLHQFLEHYKDKKKILGYTPSLTMYRKTLDNDNARETAMNVFTTWELSFQQLLRGPDGVAKGELLSLFAFFENKNISEELFKAYCKAVPGWRRYLPNNEDSKMSEEIFSHPWPVPCLEICLGNGSNNGTSDSENTNWSTHRYTSFVEEFARKSLVQSWSPSGQENEFSHLTIHPLVRDWIRLRLDNEKSIYYALLATKILSAFLRTKWDGASARFKIALPIQQIILSHVEVCEQNRKLLEARTKVARGQERLDDSDYWIWNLLDEVGRYDQAEKIALRAYQGRLQHLGPEHRSTIAAASNLASAYRKTGKLDKCEELRCAALKSMRILSGSNDIDTLRSQRQLAEVLLMRGDNVEAENVIRDCLQRLEKVAGPDDAEVLRSNSLLAELLMDKGDYIEAEIMYRRILDCRERVLGANHVATLLAVGCLGAIYLKEEQFALAEEMLRRALQGSEELYGREHPNTLTSVHNLAILFSRMGELGRAEEMMRRAAEGKERVLGGESLGTRNSVGSLAIIVHRQGRYEEAEKLYQRSLPGLARMLGPKHKDVNVSAGWYRSLMKAMGKERQGLAWLAELNIHLETKTKRYQVRNRPGLGRPRSPDRKGS